MKLTGRLQVALAMTLTGFAGIAGIVSTSGSADFGLIKESDGPKTIRTYVRNDSSAPVAILKVSPTCGCTAVNFQKDIISQGDSAWIDLTYNPNRRPGRFEKAVKVYPSEGEMIRIPIKGVVMSSAETIQQMFPVSAGLLHLSEKTLIPARPLSAGSKTFYIDVYNSGEKPVYMKLEKENDAVDFQFFPEVVASAEKGMIGIYVDAQKEEATGPIEYVLRLYTSFLPDDFEDSQPTEIKILTEK